MADSFPDAGIDQLTVPERLELIARLWDSIPDSMDALPVPEWHRQELERRLAADDNAEPPIPWEQLRTSLRQNP